MLHELIEGTDLETDVPRIVLSIHENGPVNPLDLEKLAYYKHYHRVKFAKYENLLLNTMGLFYKTDQPHSLLESIYAIISETILEETGKTFTPVQASQYKSIKQYKYYSFSAPTSAGKSFLLREIIEETTGDTVIVLPSRALISEYYAEITEIVGKNVLVLQFIDDINKDLTNRRIFIVTPERGAEIFKQKDKFNFELFLFDEAQISEDPTRGMRFDAFVRRIDRIFPTAKKVFAHPFVSNPEAQLQKHNFTDSAHWHNFQQQSVGKIFMHYEDGKFVQFSPHTGDEQKQYNSDIAREVLSNNGTMLIYIAKRKIYDGSYRIEFSEYIDLCPKITDPTAIDLVQTLKDFIGAKETGSDKHSNLIELMERGVVTHHGSMPLKARLLVEKFIKDGLARICFSTSTLNQGINMPFDLVWIDNFRNVLDLTLKNLIGRAGRTTQRTSYFDYGFTVIKRENQRTFTERYNSIFALSSNSLLDDVVDSLDEDERDLADAIKNDNFNDELQLPQTQVDRIIKSPAIAVAKYILDTILTDNLPMTGHAYYNLPDAVRTKIKQSFKVIFIAHLRRQELTKAELSVLSAAIPIMLWHIQGKSFSEIISLRHSYLTRKTERSSILRSFRDKDITATDAKQQMEQLTIKYSPTPSSLPYKKLRGSSSFPVGENIRHIDYDTIVYDTYDYLDKVISFSLTNPICAAFDLYTISTGDTRGKIFSNYIRYGTNNDTEIWLLRYGFGFEDIEWIIEHVATINENRITFKDTVDTLSQKKKDAISRYV